MAWPNRRSCAHLVGAGRGLRPIQRQGQAVCQAPATPPLRHDGRVQPIAVTGRRVGIGAGCLRANSVGSLDPPRRRFTRFTPTLGRQLLTHRSKQGLIRRRSRLWFDQPIGGRGDRKGHGRRGYDVGTRGARRQGNSDGKQDQKRTGHAPTYSPASGRAIDESAAVQRLLHGGAVSGLIQTSPLARAASSTARRSSSPARSIRWGLRAISSASVVVCPCSRLRAMTSAR